jgi:competence protein ComEC
VAYTIRTVEFLASFPGGALNLGEVSLVLVIAFYAVLFGLTFIRTRSEMVGRWLKPGVALTGLVVMTVVIWRAVLAAPDDRLHMTLLDVGTGDAILIQTPSGRTVLIDGGPSSRSLSDGLGRRLPIGQRQLDWLVVAATGADQLGGLTANIERFPADQVLWAGPQSGSYQVGDLQEKINELEIPVVSARTGQVLDLGEGVELQVIEVCDRGAVLLLEWNNFRALLPIGMDFDTLENMQSHEELRGITALLLAESGFAPLNPGNWIDDLAPQVVLLSVAAGDLEGLPSPETINAVEGYHLLRTDQNGWVDLISDEEKLWVEVEKE